ncbi:Protein CBG24986 [Caenorhabditis briggsae]|uniref:Protein CBG24986 n=1 Tax=Caenorhabditis briggsae TaxID=6238 RepID=A8WLW7_CAEBR|nr:Protein CBG24986 [Caenorhabditis briggsae]CAP21465.2 Protein CBG24986 [Caenorhabditis briggsae]
MGSGICGRTKTTTPKITTTTSTVTLPTTSKTTTLKTTSEARTATVSSWTKTTTPKPTKRSTVTLPTKSKSTTLITTPETRTTRISLSEFITSRITSSKASKTTSKFRRAFTTSSRTTTSKTTFEARTTRISLHSTDNLKTSTEAMTTKVMTSRVTSSEASSKSIEASKTTSEASSSLVPFTRSDGLTGISNPTSSSSSDFPISSKETTTEGPKTTSTLPSPKLIQKPTTSTKREEPEYDYEEYEEDQESPMTQELEYEDFLDQSMENGGAETREYACTRQSSRASKSECMLRFGELSAINDNGCFMHFDSEKQESIELCPLQCQRFNEATILKSSDSLICSPGVAVGVERRQSDWFMWRSGACKSSDVIFQIECSTSQMKEEEQLVEVNEEIQPIVEEVPVMRMETDNGISEDMDRMTSSIEDITSGTEKTQESTTTHSETNQTPLPETAEQEDDLPEKVDTLLGFLFPSYRKKALSQ